MDTIRNWLLPALLAAGQLIWWATGADPAGADGPGPVRLAAALAVLAVETAALGHRRQAPVRCLAWTLGTLVAGQVAWEEGCFGFGTLVALYSVAVRRPVPVTVRAVAAAVGVEWLLSFAHLGFRPALASEWALGALVYLVCAGLGEGRRQWLDGRSAAARRLAGAEEARRRAADTERRRLARELHDVSAHHLTSVVITADAARRLGPGRPELTAEALSFARRTGAETLTSLQRLVGLLWDTEDDARSGPTTARIEELIAGFGRLGRPIETDLPADLAGPAAEAVHGIVREALTNTLRHAPGGAARVAVRRGDGVLELTVDNAAPRGSAPSGIGGLGSGRGLTGMRERAAAVGGELTAGPRPDGGWRVRATLPDATGPRSPDEGSGRRDVLREQRLADPVLVFSAAVLPLLSVLIAAEDWTGTSLRGALPGLSVLAVLLTVHAVPLLWRRRAPWAALLGVLATSWLWPVTVVVADVPVRVSRFFDVGAVAELLAVYAMGVYGRGAARTWPAWGMSAVSLSAVVVATAAAEGRLTGTASVRLTAVLVFVPLAVLTAGVFAALWGAGLAVRRRRLRVLALDDHALATSLWHAERAADAERRRLAARLRDAVLERTAALVERARQGQLDEVAAEARAALSAMRELLHGLGGSEEPGRHRSPAPAAADLVSLCRDLSSSGRRVRVRGLPKAARDLPSPVALSAYGIVETALGAGDQGPARVTFRRRREVLRVTVSGVPLAVTGPVAGRLRARVPAGAGRIVCEEPGIVRALLSARPGPEPVQEVSPSSRV
ncbi:sensor histidine kinase [Streptomyces sp. NPDC101213]|uniref:sensor histidine kinase n=1 Tax=Streptomyces sp. NPDC101213 TaxID=3366130 RepID=UPI0037F7381D